MSENDIPSSQSSVNRFGQLQEAIYAFLYEKLLDKDTIKKYEHVS